MAEGTALDQQAVEIVAQALDDIRERDRIAGQGPVNEDADWFIERLADAGYSVVKSEWEYGYTLGPGVPYNVPSFEVALEVIAELRKRDEVATRVITHRREESRALRVEKARALSDLSSLRSAVAHLADQLDEAVQTIPAFDAAGLGRRGGLRDAARLVRSLLPQEGPQ